MSDLRFESGHLEFPRRQEFRRRRDDLYQARGWLTMAGARLGDLGDAEDWPVRPQRLLPGTRYLLVLEGGAAYPLRTGLNTLGRFPENDIHFEEIHVSRRHCAFLVHAWGGCDLCDTASRNGTFVNGARVDRLVRLDSGDRIRVCDHLLLFLSERDYESEANRSGDYAATAVL
jgi:pSer/pThr/pTyr-binding forkhead associated (FHA) protein